MSKFYYDYFWKNGKPYGVGAVHDSSIPEKEVYKVIADPYYKRISLEKYRIGLFESIIYDSALFDFRHLKLAEQLAWQKTLDFEDKDSAISLIRNQDDRIVLKESYTFEALRCRKCQISSPHGIPLGIQHLHYKALGDNINGVVLFDINFHPVMYKLYEIDETSGEFSQLLEEEWNMEKTLSDKKSFLFDIA